MIFLGIDLAALEKRPSGYCILEKINNELLCKTGIIKKDSEIIKLAHENKPIVISIDSPLSFSKNGKAFRLCDIEARRRGFMVLPLNISSMKLLTLRGIRIKKELSGMGFEVIEVFPTGAFKSLNIPLPKRDFNKTIENLRKLNLKFDKVKTIHELDAIISAYTAYKYYKKEAIILGDQEEGTIVFPL
jgi:predicted nuclease with RNAse H fold